MIGFRYFYNPIRFEIDIGHVTASFRVNDRHQRIGDAKGQVKLCSVSMILFADTSQMGYSSFRLKYKTIWNLSNIKSTFCNSSPF